MYSNNIVWLYEEQHEEMRKLADRIEDTKNRVILAKRSKGFLYTEDHVVGRLSIAAVDLDDAVCRLRLL